MGWKSGGHSFEEAELEELAKKGCSHCGSPSFLVYAYCEAKREVCQNEDGDSMLDWGWQMPEEIFDDLAIECAECNATHWTDDNGWIENPKP